jgi:hypothetical protein
MARDLFEEAGIDPNEGNQQGGGRDLFAEAGIEPQQDKGFLGRLFDYADVGASGLVRGATGALGLPVDAVNSALGLIGLGSEKPVGGSEYLRETLMPKEPKAKGLGQQIVKAVGEQIGGAAVPVAGAASRVKMTAPLFNALVGNLNELPLASLLKAQALTATGAGVGSGVAREAFPDSATADVIGQLIGGIGVPGTAALVNKAINVAKKKVVDPLFRTDEAVSQQLKGMLGDNPLYQNNWRATEDVASEIPGLRPTLGQSTNAPNAIVTERALMRKGGGMANDAIDLNRQNMGAVKDYAGQIIPEGSLQNTTGAVMAKQGGLQSEVDDLLQRATAGSPDKQGAGKAIYTNLREAKETARQGAKSLFDQIEQSSNPKLDAADLQKTLSNVSSPMHQFVGPEDYPEITGRLKKFFEKQEGDNTVRIGKGGDASEFPPELIAKNPELQKMLDGTNEISFKDLRGLRSEIASEIRKEKSFPQPNDKKIMRLAELQQSVQRTLDQLSDPEFIAKKGYDPGLRDMYEAAVTKYKDEYVPYKQGATRDVLRAGPSGEEPAVPYSAIAGKFFKTGRGAKEAAQEFIKNAGSREDAKKALEGYIYRDLLDNATVADGNKLDSKKYAAWFKSHQEALGEFPELRSDLLSLKNAQAKVDEIASIAKPFEGDSDRIMQRILTAKNPNEEMNRLMRVIKEDPAGTEGLRKAFWDEALNKSTTRRIDVAGEQMINPAALKDHMKKYSGIYSKLYTQEERASMEKVQKAYEVIMRTDKTPLGSGSDTAENINNAASLAAWAGMRLFGNRSFMLAAPIAKIIGSIPQEKRLALLEQALLDPEVAKGLMAIQVKEPGKALRAVKKLADLTKNKAWMVNLPRAGSGDNDKE